MQFRVISSANVLNIFAESCDAGKFFDPTDGCQPCPVDTYSPAANKLAECTPCPKGKGVAAGLGAGRDACEWSEFIQTDSFSPMPLKDLATTVKICHAFSYRDKLSRHSPITGWARGVPVIRVFYDILGTCTKLHESRGCVS